jgi:hypothetical protein
MRSRRTTKERWTRTKTDGSRTGLEAAEGLGLEERLALRAQGDVVVLGLSIIQAVERDHVDVCAIFHHHPLRVLPGRASGAGKEGGLGPLADPAPRARQRLAEALGAIGLQHVVDRVHLEGAEGVIVVGGDEYDRHLRIEQLQDLEPVELRHLDVEEHHFRLELRRGLDRLQPGRGLAQDLHVGIRGKHLAQEGARGGLVVHDQHADHSAASAGIEIATRKLSSPRSATTRAWSP